MIKNFNHYNESLRDEMKPKDDEEIKKKIDRMEDVKKLKYIQEFNLWELYTENEIQDIKLNALGFKTQEELDKAIKGDGIDKIYDVYSGVDAFVFDKIKDEKIYAQYISVIATSELDARFKVAKILGQELFDQEINHDYENYVSDHVVYKTNF